MNKVTYGLVLFSAVVGYMFFFPGSKESVGSLLDYRNPYSRKPASLSAPQEVVETESVDKTKLQIKLSKLYTLKDCYTSDCDIASNDAREYELTIGSKLKKELLSFYEEVLKSGKVSSEIEDVALEFLAINDGHVKEAALLLLSTQPPTQVALNGIIDNVLDYHDPNLIGLALIELEKYKSEEYNLQIKESFVRNFREGSLLVKEALAKGIYKFVNHESRSQYENILNNLPKNSRVRKNLKASLERYDYRSKL
ncbi:hypothetical protein [Bacteriovorax sp. Seq25_V]|uniref:hypothetical protein n=1 Tax=Bacteriovorax sp. Seq25_V TaxID=1201288 RepID=UPI00038A1050|nr:hypothetical protein [Bacteriovorax sp. Seq25_V]EQC46656.1 hypothetical protein M900_2364 [Bacteriovorax sp. Seq25_V]